MEREISKVLDPSMNKISAIHENRWLLEPGHWQEYDPFLLLAEDRFQKGAFASHPHRGMETFTYVMEGQLEHRDNKAGEGVLKAGDAQLMTAGKGVMHLEDPLPGETVHSLQLWINLPAVHKMTAPRYQNLNRDTLRKRYVDNAVVTVYSGCSGDVCAETENYVPLTIVEIEIEAGGSFTQDIPSEYNGFIYVVKGKGMFGSKETQGEKGQILWLSETNGAEISEISIKAADNLRLLLFAGKPLKESVVAKGPFVMNTEEEVQQAYADFRNGTFLD